MNPNRFFLPPRYMGMPNNMMTFSPMMRITNNPIGRTVNIGNIGRSGGLFSKITSGIRSVNWGGLLNNANKTLNVVNQTIPLVRQAGPMVNNMKNMLRIAKVFNSETNNNNNNNMVNNIKDNQRLNNDYMSNNENINLIQKKEVQNNNNPNFFI